MTVLICLWDYFNNNFIQSQLALVLTLLRLKQNDLKEVGYSVTVKPICTNGKMIENIMMPLFW